MPDTHKPIYFLSDVHLGVGSAEEESQKESLLLSLLNEIRLCGSALYVVGDLFDFWFEYRHVIPRGYHNILSALHSLTANNVKIIYLMGNHDFGIGDFFSNDLNVTVVAADWTFDHLGKKFYLSHGDGLAAKDTGYRILKKFLRNKLVLKAFRFLHPDLGFFIAKKFSHSSRDYTSKKNYGEMDGMRKFAQATIDSGFDFVILGHSHIPRFEAAGRGFYINLGDWMKHFSYAVYQNGEMKVLSFRSGVPQQLFQI
jgi:UDP-2,3-diacylglucosamine hydrolase